MPFPREYAPRKRWMMVLTMWGILLATLGLAATLGRSSPPVELGLERRVGEITVRLPAGWSTRSDNVMFVRQRVVAEERTSDPRLLAVNVESDSGRFPQDIVLDDLAGRGVNQMRYVEDDFPIGPFRGMMIGGERRGGWRGGGGMGFAVAVARLPDAGKVVRIELQSRQLSRADVNLMRRVAESVEYRRPVRPAAVDQEPSAQ